MGVTMLIKKATFWCIAVEGSVAASDQFNRMQEDLFDNESHWICLHHYSIASVLQSVFLLQILSASLGRQRHNESADKSLPKSDTWKTIRVSPANKERC